MEVLLFISNMKVKKRLLDNKSCTTDCCGTFVFGGEGNFFSSSSSFPPLGILEFHGALKMHLREDELFANNGFWINSKRRALILIDKCIME